MKNTGAVIRRIELTEKASSLSDSQGKYFFEVNPSANKLEIKRAVEQIFKVAVASVNTMRYLGKKKRERTAQYGQRPDWKRAVVTLKEGNRIELA